MDLVRSQGRCDPPGSAAAAPTASVSLQRLQVPQAGAPPSVLVGTLWVLQTHSRSSMLGNFLLLILLVFPSPVPNFLFSHSEPPN
jgi:hypothetical protein